jgi:hypothetical protein
MGATDEVRAVMARDLLQGTPIADLIEGLCDVIDAQDERIAQLEAPAKELEARAKVTVAGDPLGLWRR